MATLGLVESKQLFPFAPSGETAVDPDAGGPETDVQVVNPVVTMDNIYTEWAKVYLNLQNNYKFVLPVARFV